MQKYKEILLTDGSLKYKGDLIIDNYKLFIQTHNKPQVETYTPLDKIELIEKKSNGMIIRVKLSPVNSRSIFLETDKKTRDIIIKSLVDRLNLKKKFLKSVWIGKPTFRR